MISHEDAAYPKITIRDIEEKELEGEPLSEKELEALHLFRKIRLKKLKKVQTKEDKFHSRFEHFRKLSSLLDYKDFLADTKIHL